MTGPSESADPVSPPPDRALCGARYRILAPIASGGMADVYEAEDAILGRRVAIKVLKQFVQASADGADVDDGGWAAEAAHSADRMRVEARALALVAHPNIVSVIDFGVTTDARPFIVTERLKGRSLGAELRERTFVPVAEAIDIMLGVLAALEAVHAKGIVHRDVKPGNVFVCAPVTPGASPIVKLLDFGVAKMVDEGSVKHVAPAYLTKKGSMVGTPRYITPEQAFGHPVDARTDLYAVGLLLYVLVAGRPAFESTGDISVLVETMRHVGASPPSKVARQPIPAELDDVILKALAWSAPQRFQSARAFADALSCIPRAPRHVGEQMSTIPEEPPTDRTLEARTEVVDSTSRSPLENGLSRPVFVLAIFVSAAIVLVLVLLLMPVEGGTR